MNRKTVVSTIALALVMTALPASSAAAAKAKRCGSKNEVRKLVKRNSWSCAKAFRYARSVPDRKYAPDDAGIGQARFRHGKYRCHANLVPPQNDGSDVFVTCYKGKISIQKKPVLKWELNYDYLPVDEQ